MRKSAVFATAALATTLGFATAGVNSAAAKPGWKGGHPPGFSHGVKSGWRGGSHPPGWSRGVKRGWYRGGGAGGMPPRLRGR